MGFYGLQNKYARFQSDPFQTVGGVDYTNSIPYDVTNGQTDRQAGADFRWIVLKPCILIVNIMKMCMWVFDGARITFDIITAFRT